MFRRKRNNPSSYDDRIREVEYKARVADLRWKHFKYGVPLLIIAFIVGSTLYNKWSGAPVAPIVHLEGTVAGGNRDGTADSLVRQLKLAFNNKNAVAVILVINSPGGAPAEAERVTAYLDAQRKANGKPVYAVCTTLCASAAYMIAAHSDKLYAGRYSLVGSIGAIMKTWNFSEATKKIGVTQNAYASGDLKNMLDPYTPVRPEDSAKAQALVDDMGREFADEIRHQRGDKLKVSENHDLFSGGVWTGSQALDLGLIDEIATVEKVMDMHFKKGTKVWDLTKATSGFSLFKTFSDAVVQSVFNKLTSEQQSITWN